MANKIYKDMRIKIDNASASLTDITSYLSSASLRAVQDTIEDTSLADGNRSYLFGLAGASIPLSGMVNTTTDAIFGPLVGNRTTVTKTIEYRAYPTNSTGSVGRFYNGEVLITSVEYSGSVNSLETFSCEAVFDGAVNRTSTQLA
jgi:hypothetical protein